MATRKNIGAVPQISSPINIKGGVVRVIDDAAGGIATTGNAWIENEKYGWRHLVGVNSNSCMFDSSVTRTGTFTLKLSSVDITGRSRVLSGLGMDAGGSAALSNLYKYGIPIKPSTTYKLNCYVKTVNAVTDSIYVAIGEWSSVGAATQTNLTNKLSGDNDWTLCTKTFTTSATSSFAAINLYRDTAGNISDAWFDVNGLTLSEVSVIDNNCQANVVIAFDDGIDNNFTNAYPYMLANSLKGTEFIVGSFVGTTGYMTLGNLTTMYNSGWDISSHTWGHVDLRTLSLADQELELKTNRDYLDTNGFTRSSDYLAYPYGYYDSNTLIAASNVGVVAARSLLTGKETSYFEPTRKYLLRCVPVYSTDSLASIKSQIDDAISTKTTALLMFHSISNGGTTYEWPVADFEALIDYIKTKETANAINVLTFSEWVAQTSSEYLLYPAITTITSTDNIDDSLDASGAYANTYTLPTAIDEGVTHRQTLSLSKKNQTGISIWPVAKGTGDWTLTVHDSSNNVIGTPKTITNGSITTGALLSFLNSFTFVSGTYHFHVTSTVSDGTVKCNTSNDLETSSFSALYSKNTNSITIATDTEEMTVDATTADGWAGGVVIDTTSLNIPGITILPGLNNIYYSSNDTVAADTTVDASLQARILPTVYANKARVDTSSARNSATGRVTVRDMGTSLNFAGGTNKVSIPNLINNFDTTSYSFSIWVKSRMVRTNVAASSESILGTSANLGDVGTSYVFLILRNSNYMFRAQVNGGSDLNITTPQIPDRWVHLVGTVDQSDKKLRLYVNGALKNTSSAFASFGTLLTSTLNIGGGFNTSLSGKLDEPRIWSRALTATEIQNLYLHNIVPQDGLVAEYLFDEATGTTAIDTSGNGNDGTITGATYTTDVPLRPRSST